ncbi:MAG TPA: hypothetical protein DCW90_02335 [Lachnospiraceae bacterium]|nr:type II secretion system protein [uncultured Lachnoclostridium sp.]HAU84373.1 hypothetical protein [Lachnospiraceae bacterium]
MREEAKNTKKLDNKGFSLIELIIVIAIMAILIGIVGTQVVPYIEKSKQAKDQQVLSGLLTSATTAFASNAELADKAEITFNVGDDLKDANKKISDEFYELAGLKATDKETTKDALMKKLTSKASKDITSITIARSDEGVVTVTTTVKTGSKYASVFDVLSST